MLDFPGGGLGCSGILGAFSTLQTVFLRCCCLYVPLVSYGAWASVVLFLLLTVCFIKKNHIWSASYISKLVTIKISVFVGSSMCIMCWLSNINVTSSGYLILSLSVLSLRTGRCPSSLLICLSQTQNCEQTCKLSKVPIVSFTKGCHQLYPCHALCAC